MKKKRKKDLTYQTVIIISFFCGFVFAIAVAIQINFCAFEKQPFPKQAHAEVPHEQWLALDHAKHETDLENCEENVAQLDAQIDSCEDAWQSDLAECEMEYTGLLVGLNQKLIKCEGYLEQCPD